MDARSRFWGARHPTHLDDCPRVGACVLVLPLYPVVPVTHPMDMFRHEVSAVVERWVHESDLDFFEMMVVLEEVKMDLMIQNIEPDEDPQ